MRTVAAPPSSWLARLYQSTIFSCRESRIETPSYSSSSSQHLMILRLDGLASHSKILTMSDPQDCTQSLLADHELWFDIEFDSAESSTLERGYVPPFLEVDTQVRVATTLDSQAHKHDAY